MADWRRSLLQLVRIDGIARGTLWLSGGSLLAMVLGIAALPWLTRLYGPDAFGNLAVFAALVAALAPAATLRFELGIAAHRRDDQAFAVLGLALASALLIAVLSGLLLWLLAPALGPRLGANLDARIVVLVPLGVVLSAAATSAGYWLTRSGEYPAQAVVSVVTSMVRVLAQVLAAPLRLFGLTLGTLIAQGFSVAVAAVLVLRRAPRRLSLRRWRALMRRHADLPRHAWSTSFINGVASNLLPVLLAVRFGPQVAGILFLAQQVLATPLNLFAQAVWRVAFVRLMTPGLSAVAQREQVATLHDNQARVLVLVLVPLVALAPSAAQLLGAAWQPVSVVLPLVAVMVLANTLSNVSSYFVAFGEYRAESWWNLIVVAVKLLVLLLVPVLELAALPAIGLWCFANLAVYLALNFWWGRRLMLLPRFGCNVLGFALPALAGAAWIAVQFESLPVRLSVAVMWLLLALAWHRLLLRFLSVSR